MSDFLAAHPFEIEDGRRFASERCAVHSCGPHGKVFDHRCGQALSDMEVWVVWRQINS
jgi:hypothetical protein